MNNSVLNKYEYDAFGNTTSCEEKVYNPFRYRGQQFDAITNQYYLRARYYNPVIGRFTQEDTYHGDGLLYAYCDNNPVKYYDPSGYSKVDATENKRALQSLVDEINERGGATAEERTILNGWADEYGVPKDSMGLESQKQLPGPTSSSGVEPRAKVPSSGTSSDTLLLDVPKGTNPWMDGTDIISMEAPENCYISMALSPGQNTPGGWGTFDDITDVNYVRNNLAVTPEFKPEVGSVQTYLIPKGTQIQVGIVGPQTYGGITFAGGGNQVQILNFADRANLIPIGDAIEIH